MIEEAERREKRPFTHPDSEEEEDEETLQFICVD